MELNDNILRRVESLEREIEYIKRDLFHVERKSKEKKLSLFGSVRGGDISDEMIKEAKEDLFGKLEDV